MTCDPNSIELDIVGGDYFTFSCTVTTEMVGDFTVRVEWQAMTTINAASRVQIVSFSATSGQTQTVVFTGEANIYGTHILVLKATEPGSDVALDTVTIQFECNRFSIYAEPSDQMIIVTFRKSSIIHSSKHAIGALVLFFLMGLLIIRG